MDQKGNSGLVLVRAQGGEVADVACGRDNRFIDVNGVGASSKVHHRKQKETHQFY